MAYDLISFDLDGTLVDTAAEIAEAVNRALESHGMARRPVPQITNLIGAGTRDLMLALLARCLLEQPALADTVSVEGVLASMDEHYAALAGSSALAYAGCSAALTRLRSAGLLLACVTNKEHHHAMRVLHATGLAGHFELVIGGDSLPEKKPHASVLRHVAAALGASTARTAHVGDSATDVAAARNAGVAAWAVPYGYNAGVPIAQAQPQRVFASLAQVAEHVLAGRALELGEAESLPASGTLLGRAASIPAR
ncbi:MAG: HAD-IA family hydrolase [Burkholderiaceae bacterium]